MHAPEVECIGKGKARKPYELGVKAAIVVSHKASLMMGARTFRGNPYDGHILSAAIEQATNLMQDLPVKIEQIVVDLGFRGVDADNPGMEIIYRGRIKSLSRQQKTRLRRRQAVEPAIGHLKSDHRMDRCWLQGAAGDALHAVSCAAGFNRRWLLPRCGLAGGCGVGCTHESEHRTRTSARPDRHDQRGRGQGRTSAQRFCRLVPPRLPTWQSTGHSGTSSPFPPPDWSPQLGGDRRPK